MTNNAPQQPVPLSTDDPPMSLDQARRVIWPFDARQPMGQMLDQHTLTRSKLQWAAEKAKWPDVRRAALRLIEELDPAPAPAAFAPTAPPMYGSPAVAAVAAPPRFG